MENLYLRAVSAPWWGGVEFLLILQQNGIRAIAEPVVMRALSPDEEGRSLDATFKLSLEAAQQLLDELWQCGIRPTNGAGSVGQLAATQAHLEDMRRLVFRSFDR